MLPPNERLEQSREDPVARKQSTSNIHPPNERIVDLGPVQKQPTSTRTTANPPNQKLMELDDDLLARGQFNNDKNGEDDAFYVESVFFMVRP